MVPVAESMKEKPDGHSPALNALTAVGRVRCRPRDVPGSVGKVEFVLERVCH